MFKGIRGRIISNYLILIVFFMLALGIGLIWPLEKYYLGNLQNGMINQAKLVSDIAKEQVVNNNYKSLNEQVKTLAKKINTRITIILLDGKVIADSESDPQIMENHGNRPEIKDAVVGKIGSQTRFSTTLQTDMMYVAIPLEYGGEIIGVTRLSMSLREVNKTFINLIMILATGIVIVALIVFLLSLKLAKGLTKPIEAISEGAHRIASGDLNTKVYSGTKDEIGELGQTINFMTKTLKEKINEISQEKSRLENILTTIGSGVIMLDNYGLVRIVNPAAEEIFGISLATAKDKHNLEVIRNFGLNEQIEKCLTHEIIIDYEFTIIHPEEKILQCYIAPVYRYKVISGVTIVFHDITSLRRLEQMRADFVANASHELRTPLTAIKGYAETLLDGALDDRGVSEKFVTIIDQEANRLIKLVEELLTLSRAENQQQENIRQSVDILTIIKSVSEQMKNSFNAKNVTLTLDLPDILSMVKVNPDRIKQVMVNILDNALKYTPEGGKVQVKAWHEEENVKVTVCDTGLGIPEKDLSRIFERFYRVDKARTRRMGGFGLGLSIVKHIIESSGGRIGVKSTVNNGSVFWFTLPRNVV